MAGKPVRKDSAVSGRFYAVDGRMLPSVTHILQAIAKPALIAWAANTERAAVTEAAADLYGEWTAAAMPTMPRDWYLATLTARLGMVKAHQKALATAGEIGSQIHAMIEWQMKTQLGVAGPKPVIQDKATWAVMAFEDFAKAVTLTPIRIEQTVYSLVHGYAGTMDLLARVNGVLTLIDIKSGKSVYPEAFLQTAAYRVALEEMGMEAPKEALILRLPKVDTDPAFEVVPVPPVDDLFPVFLATKRLWEWSYKNDEAFRLRQREAKATA